MAKQAGEMIVAAKLKHLEMIQGVINRMAHCAFLLKGWTVILLSALLALAAKDADPLFVYLAYLPTIAFWILDSFYLRQERLYRELYDHVALLNPEAVDYSMAIDPFTGTKGCKLRGVVFSGPMLLFYGTLVLLLTVTVVTINAPAIAHCAHWITKGVNNG